MNTLGIFNKMCLTANIYIHIYLFAELIQVFITTQYDTIVSTIPIPNHTRIKNKKTALAFELFKRASYTYPEILSMYPTLDVNINLELYINFPLPFFENARERKHVRIIQTIPILRGGKKFWNAVKKFLMIDLVAPSPP